MKRIAFALASLSLAAAAHAQVTLTDPWVRATVPQQKATGLFMHIDATQDVRLVSGQSPVAGVVEVHEMAMEGDVMKMRHIPALDIPAGKAVELKPGGYHIMLMDLPKPVSAGETIPLTLVFEDKQGQRSEVTVQAPVRALNSTMAKPKPHGHQHGGHSH